MRVGAKAGRRWNGWAGRWTASAALWLFPLICFAGLPKEEGVGGYLQIRLTLNEKRSDLLSLRRSKIWFRRTTKKGGCFVQFLYKEWNRSRTDGKVYLQEARVWFKTPHGTVTIGQFKPPFSRERFTWDGALDIVDRAKATNCLIPCGKLGESFVRDYGVQWSAKALRGRLRYAVALQVGNGANNKFRGNGPLLTARVVWRGKPGIYGGEKYLLQVEAAFSTRRDKDIDFSKALPGTKALGYDHFKGRDTRWNLGLDARYGRWRLVGESYWARFKSSKAGVPSVSATGYYLQLTYRPSPLWSASLKFEAFDPNRSVVDKNDVRWLGVGLNFYPKGLYRRWWVTYYIRRERKGERANNALIVQFQQVW